MRQTVFAAIFLVLLAMSLLTANASTKSELHWNICEESAEDVIKKLDLQLKETERRKVSYYDRWSEELQDFENYSQGVILRVRSFEDNTFKSTVKLAFNTLPEMSEEWTTLEGFKCESDLNSNKVSYFCSLSEDIENFSPLQQKFVRDFAIEPEWSLLKEYGPVSNSVWEFKRPQKEKLVLEQLLLNSGEKILELSTRTDLESAVAEFEEQSHWFQEKQIKFCPVQESKTRRVLQSYKN